MVGKLAVIVVSPIIFFVLWLLAVFPVGLVLLFAPESTHDTVAAVGRFVALIIAAIATWQVLAAAWRRV
jgi:hypothetical protein